MVLIDFDDAEPSYEMVHPAAPGEPKSNFAMMYLSSSEYIRLVQFPLEICEGFDAVITSAWPKGIKQRQWVDGYLEFVLNGTPWGGMFAADAIHGRDLMCGVFSYLHSRGWVLVANPFHTVHKSSKDTLIFKNVSGPDGLSPEVSSPAVAAVAAAATTTTMPAVDFMALSMPPADRLRVHGGDEEVIAELQRLLEKFDYFQSASRVETSWQFKMKGYPWMAMCGKRPHKLRKFILAVMETMDRLGWSSYATIRQRTTDDNPKPHTWYFVRPKDWVSGSPFNGERVSYKTYY